MNGWLQEPYLVLWLHTWGPCWCDPAWDFLKILPNRAIWRHEDTLGKQKTGEGAHLDAQGWERRMRVWLEKTLHSCGGSCLWEIPRDWRDPISTWKAPRERGGQLGTSQVRLLLPSCLSSLSCPQTGDFRNLIGSGEGWCHTSSSSLKPSALQQA